MAGEEILLIGGGIAAALLLGGKKKTPEETAVEQEAIIEEAPPEVVEAVKEEIIQEAAPKKIGDCVKIEAPYKIPPQPARISVLTAKIVALEIARNKEIAPYLKAASVTTGKAKKISDNPEVMAIQQKYALKINPFVKEKLLLKQQWSVEAKAAGEKNKTAIKAMREKYSAMGWKFHSIYIPTYRRGGVETIDYACPPGKLPLELQTQLDNAIKSNKCISEGVGMTISGGWSGMNPSVRKALLDRGWRVVREKPKPVAEGKPAEQDWKGVIGRLTATEYLCPPGVKHPTEMPKPRVSIPPQVIPDVVEKVTDKVVKKIVKPQPIIKGEQRAAHAEVLGYVRKAEKDNKPFYGGGIPFLTRLQVEGELQKRGWVRIQPPMPWCPPGHGCIQAFPQSFLVPPGTEGKYANVLRK